MDDINKELRRYKMGWGIAISFFFVVLIFMTFFTYTVERGTVGVIKRFGEIQYVQDKFGLHLKYPIIDSAEVIETKMLHYNIPKSGALTSDKKAFTVDSYMVWRIVNPAEFIRQVGNRLQVEQRLDAAVYSSTKNVIGMHTQDSLIGLENDEKEANDNKQSDEKEANANKQKDRKRSNANQLIYQQANDSIKLYGVEAVNVEIKALDVPEENQKPIYGRMISERNHIATSYVANGKLEADKILNSTAEEIIGILGEAKKDSETINGKAESEYMQKMESVYNTPSKQEFYKFVRSLEYLEKSLSGTKTKTVILSKDSDIAKMLLGKN